MIFTGRSRELGRIRALLDRRQPSFFRVSGLPGVGKSALLARAAADYDGIHHWCPPLPDPEQRARLAERIRGTLAADGTSGDSLSADSTWAELLDAAVACAAATDRPFVLVLDDAHRLSEARSRVGAPLEAALARAAASTISLHVVLIGREGGLPDIRSDDPVTRSSLRVEPLPLRAAAPHLPGNRPHERVRAYGVFGGVPRVLGALDTSVTVGTNVRRLLLDDTGSLAASPMEWLEREVQTPSRYVAILRSLASGEADWATLHAGVPDLTRSGQVAPYLNRLVELGLIEIRRSLDSSPTTRTTRYAITDPFVAFWFRFIFPWRLSDQSDPIGPYYASEIRPGINAHMEQMLPRICRQHMSFDAIETLGAVAREGGSLWGSDAEIPVAGTLTSGAVYYGATGWAEPETGHSPLDGIDAEVRETRYGFGRERRLRLIFTGRTAPTWLRRDVARRHDAALIDAEGLLGEE